MIALTDFGLHQGLCICFFRAQLFDHLRITAHFHILRGKIEHEPNEGIEPMQARHKQKQ